MKSCPRYLETQKPHQPFSALHEKCQRHLGTARAQGGSYSFGTHECSLSALGHTDKIPFPLQARKCMPCLFLFLHDLSSPPVFPFSSF